MDLYGITIRYLRKKAQPVLDHVHVDRETSRYYIVRDRKAFLDYRLRIEKGSNTFGFSPLAAWQNYVKQCHQLRVSLRWREEEAASRQMMATHHIMEMEGGTK